MSVKAISIGIGCFLAILAISGFFTEQILQGELSPVAIAVVVLWVLPGYVTALVSKRLVVIHTTVTALVCSILFTIPYLVFVDNAVLLGVPLVILTSSTILFGFGAILWLIQQRIGERST